MARLEYGNGKPHRYQTRKGYEQLYFHLLKERRASFKGDIKNVSDFHLLCSINRELCKQNCLMMDAEELEMELH